MIKHRAFLDPSSYAITNSCIVDCRLAPGQIWQDYVVLRSQYLGDGQYSVLLARHYIPTPINKEMI
jgi:hypothetical protein